MISQLFKQLESDNGEGLMVDRVISAFGNIEKPKTFIGEQRAREDEYLAAQGSMKSKGTWTLTPEQMRKAQQGDVWRQEEAADKSGLVQYYIGSPEPQFIPYEAEAERIYNAARLSNQANQ